MCVQMCGVCVHMCLYNVSVCMCVYVNECMYICWLLLGNRNFED